MPTNDAPTGIILRGWTIDRGWFKQVFHTVKTSEEMRVLVVEMQRAGSPVVIITFSYKKPEGAST